MNPTLGAHRGAYAGTRAALSQAHAVGTANLQADPPADQQAEVQAAIAELLRDSRGYAELIERAHLLAPQTVTRVHSEADALLAVRFGSSASAPLERAGLNVVLLSRLLRRPYEAGRPGSEAIVFADALIYLNALAGRRRGESQGYQTAEYAVNHLFVGENANLGAMSILVNVGGVTGIGAAILKVRLDGAASHPLYLGGNPPKPGQNQPEALGKLSQRLMLGMLVADDSLQGAAAQHETVLQHYLERKPELSAAVRRGISAVARSGVRTLWGVMIRNHAERHTTNTKPQQLKRMIDAVVKVASRRTAEPGTTGIVFFGDRVPPDLQPVVRACPTHLPVFDLTQTWSADWGGVTVDALDLRGQAVLYATLAQEHALVAIVGNKSGALDLPAHVGVPTVQVEPLAAAADPLANRIGLLSLVSDSWSFVPDQAVGETAAKAVSVARGASDPTCDAIASCLDRAWQRRPHR